MKTKLHFFLFFILSSLLGCTTTAQTIQDSSFFPLAIGNKWIYQNGNHTYSDTVTVVDTQQVSGKLYYAVQQHSSYRYLWFRNDSNKVYMVDTVAVRLDPSNVREYLLYDFSAALEDNWTVTFSSNVGIIDCDYGGKITLKSKNDTMITPTGTFTHCYSFSHNSPCMDAGIYKEFFASGIGRVAYFEVTFHGMEILVLSYSNIITGIKDDDKTSLISKYKLLQNFPNPFNPVTTISFELPERSHVLAEIYDIIGRKIETLLDSDLTPGQHNVLWNASNKTSGIYFCKVATKDFTQTIKLDLIR